MIKSGPDERSNLRISLLHLALRPGALERNKELVGQGVCRAADLGSEWIVTPELCISGYQFVEKIGTDWIEPHPDSATNFFCALAKLYRVVIFLGHLERDRLGRIYNSAFMIDSNGEIVGHHRKISIAAESWSSAGSTIDPVQWHNLTIGMLICADAYPPNIAAALCAKGAQLLVSPAAWGPGLHGPEGEWESRTVETGLPLIVCNRTGRETSLDFSRAESLVIKEGQRLLSHKSRDSVVLTFDWDLERMAPASAQFLVSEIQGRVECK
jgi:predicted amidohydrolase